MLKTLESNQASEYIKTRVTLSLYSKKKEISSNTNYMILELKRQTITVAMIAAMVAITVEIAMIMVTTTAATVEVILTTVVMNLTTTLMMTIMTTIVTAEQISLVSLQLF